MLSAKYPTLPPLAVTFETQGLEVNRNYSTCVLEYQTQKLRMVIMLTFSNESHIRLHFGEKLADTKVNARYFLGL